MRPHYLKWNALEHADTYKQAALDRAAKGGGSPFKAHEVTSDDIRYSEMSPWERAAYEIRLRRKQKRQQAVADAGNALLETF